MDKGRPVRTELNPEQLQDVRTLFQICRGFRRAGYTFSLVYIEEQRCSSGRVMSGLDGEEVGTMSRRRQYTHCDECGRTMYEYDDDVTVYEGQTLCKECFTEILKTYLYDEYIPNHLEELLEKAKEEIG